MKAKIIVISLLMTTSSILIASVVVETQFNIKMTSGQVNLLGGTFEDCKKVILASTIPTNQAVSLIKNIDSLEKVIGNQVQSQLKDTSKKAPKPNLKKN